MTSQASISHASISVATSLVPGRDHDIQTAAIASWARLGFAVASLNPAEEADDVRRQFPGTTVITATRTAEKAAGKPLPLIRDLFLAAKQNAPRADVLGVINADIILRDNPALPAALLRQNPDALLLLPRVDVPDLGACNAYATTGHETYSVGYDGAFMSPALLPAIPDSLFCIGMPFWDYWLPLMALLRGHSVGAIASPVALHVTHPTRWDRSIYLFFHAMVGDMMAACGALKRDASTPALEIVADVLQHTYTDIFARATKAGASDAATETLAAFYDRIQEVVVHHIKAMARPLAIPGA